MDTDTTTNDDQHGGLPTPDASGRVTPKPTKTGTPTRRKAARTAVLATGGSALAALFLLAALNFFGADDRDGGPYDQATAADAATQTPADSTADGVDADDGDVIRGASDDELLGGNDRDLRGDRSDDVIGDVPDAAADDLIRGSGSSDDLLGGPGPDQEVLAPGEPADLEPYVQRLCVSVQHQPVPGQPSASGIWVNGSVYGLSEDTWIWVEGPTINGGQPVQIPVQPDGTFDGGLGIDQYGDHEITRFGLWDGQPGSDPNDLLPGVVDQFGQPRIPVGPGEGPAFDQECFQIEPPTPAGPVAAGESAEAPGEDPVLMDQAVAFFDGFVTDHRAGDVDHLVQTLHPAITMAFGGDTCTQYVERTVGSITDATVLSASGPSTFELDTPGGPIGFPEVIDVEVEMTLNDGTTQVGDVHLPFHDGTPYWLTTCGWDVP